MSRLEKRRVSLEDDIGSSPREVHKDLKDESIVNGIKNGLESIGSVFSNIIEKIVNTSDEGEDEGEENGRGGKTRKRNKNKKDDDSNYHNPSPSFKGAGQIAVEPVDNHTYEGHTKTLSQSNPERNISTLARLQGIYIDTANPEGFRNSMAKVAKAIKPETSNASLSILKSKLEALGITHMNQNRGFILSNYAEDENGNVRFVIPLSTTPPDDNIVNRIRLNGDGDLTLEHTVMDEGNNRIRSWNCRGNTRQSFDDVLTLDKPIHDEPKTIDDKHYNVSGTDDNNTEYEDEDDDTEYAEHEPLDEKAQTIYETLRNKGVSANAAAGIVGNMRFESSFNPKAIGDGGTSFGLCQWHLDRRDNLTKFAESHGLDVRDVRTQIDFLFQEKDRLAIEEEMNNAFSPGEAADIFCRRFERPDLTVANIPGRQAYARHIDNLQKSVANTISKPSSLETLSEKELASINLPPRSIDKTTRFFGASNAERLAKSIGSGNFHSFRGYTTTKLLKEMQTIGNHEGHTIISSTVNNWYETDAQVTSAIRDIKRMIDICKGRATVVIFPNPNNWYKKEENKHRYDLFQEYNKKVQQLCLSYPDPKPTILDLTKENNIWDTDGYHLNSSITKIMAPYVADYVAT